jgi:catechol 2,3-dioxygenase-like lactoylglutathione lyase family enzyme
MKLLGLDHIGIVVRNIDETVTRASDTLDGRAVGERFVSDDLQVLMTGESTLELLEVRNPGFGMPKLKDGETAVIGHYGIEVDDLDDAKAELTRRGVALEGEVDAGDVRFIFTVPKTTFGVTVQLMDYKGRAKGA